ncbi:hypothetical protein [Haloechinothrix salitolerans]
MTYFGTTVVSDVIVATNQQITATLKRQPVRLVERAPRRSSLPLS